MADEPSVATLHLVPDDRSPHPTARLAAGVAGPREVVDRVADPRIVEPDGEPPPRVARLPAATVRRAQAPPRDRPDPVPAGAVPLSVVPPSMEAGPATDPRRVVSAPAPEPRVARLAGGPQVQRSAGRRAEPAGAEHRRPTTGSPAEKGRRDGRRVGPRPIDPDADPVAAAKEICLTLLAGRARTKHELAQALTRREVPADAAAAVLERFDEVGLIDDAAFAGQWVRSRQGGRGLARRALAFELRRKGVDDEVAGEALAGIDTAAEEERARELVVAKLRTVPAHTPEQRVTAARRLVGMLARKGYPGGIAYRVVREALAAHGVEGDELGEGPTDD